ncbi:hypothetical protein RI367_007994 [Sorochytrium milnesiophthora]
MAANTPVGGSAAQLDACIALLQASVQYDVPGKRDEFRLAGLIMLSRVLDVSDEAAVLKAWKAIDFDFVMRLLAAADSEKTTGMSADDAEVAETMPYVASVVLASFAHHDKCAGSPQMEQVYPILCRLLQNTKNADVARELVEIFLKAQQCSRGAQQWMQGLPIASVTASRLTMFTDEAARDMAFGLIAVCFSNPWLRGMDDPSPCLDALVQESCRHHDKVKFQLYDLLSQVLSSLPRGGVRMSGDSLATLRKDLCRILSSKLSTDLRNSALNLIGDLTYHYQSTWIVPSPAVGAVDTETLNLYRLSAQLACIELRVMLDTIDPKAFCTQVLQADNFASPPSSTDNDKRTEDMRTLRLMVTCSTIVEEAVVSIGRVVEGGNEDDKVLRGMHQNFGELMAAVVGFLAEAQDLYTAGGSDNMDMLTSAPVVTLVRLLAAYVTENPEPKFVTPLCRLLVDVCSYEQRTRLCMQHALYNPGHTGAVMTPVLLPMVSACLAEATTDKDVLAAFLEEGGYAMCMAWLQDRDMWECDEQTNHNEILIHLGAVLINMVVLLGGDGKLSEGFDIVGDALRLAPRLSSYVLPLDMTGTAGNALRNDRCTVLAMSTTYALFALCKTKSPLFSSDDEHTDSATHARQLVDTALRLLATLLLNRAHVDRQEELLLAVKDWVLLMSDALKELVRKSGLFRSAAQATDNKILDALRTACKEMSKNPHQDKDIQAIPFVVGEILKEL